MNILKNPIASTEKQLERLKICDDCPSLSANKNKCNECGCYLSYKVMLDSTKCPKQKW